MRNVLAVGRVGVVEEVCRRERRKDELAPSRVPEVWQWTCALLNGTGDKQTACHELYCLVG